MSLKLTPNELHATMGIITNFILDDGIQFHGKSYKPVTSPHTGRVWLDRNIGASRVCTSYDDAQCYGDCYQWGRGYDGHQDSGSSTTPVQAEYYTIAGCGVFIDTDGDFIISSDLYNYDWAQEADAGVSDVALVVDFNNGYQSNNYKSFSLYVRCVRAGQ